jgi:primosomal protein N' (replication factor Y)
MNIITVIPLSRSKIAAELFYFTSTVVPIGAIVSVPLRTKSIFAIVTKSESGEDLKPDLKRAPFEIRKLDKVKATVFFPATFIEACRKLSDYYATTVGAIIEAMVSDTLLDNAHKIAPPLPPQATFAASLDLEQKTVVKELEKIMAVQGDDTDRMSAWRSLIRQEFALKKSVVIYAPTIEDCEKTFRAVEKGIEGYIFKLHSGLTTKNVTENWKAISETEHPIVVIATATFSVLPRGDVKSIVIERENGRGWISQKAPYLDARHAIATIAKCSKQTVYLADSMLRMETLYAAENEEINEGSPFKWRSVSSAKDILIDMRPSKEAAASKVAESPAETMRMDNANSKVREPGKKPNARFHVFSPELEALIRTNHEESTHLFLFAVRRGLSPSTVCDDCGNIVMCKQCKAVVVLHTSPETGKNFFMCHVCGERRSADENCLACGSWRLTPLGIGIDRVHEQLKEKFPEVNVIKIDSDTTKTDKKIHEALEKFRSKPGSILLGTEVAMQHYNEKVDHVAVVSMDSLFSLPDFRIQEKIMTTLVRLRAQATRSILVQTRKAEQKVFEFGLKGNLSDFYRTSLEERKQFSYPPYSILIKITIEGKKETIAKDMGDVTNFLSPTEIDIFPAFTSTVRGKSVIHGLIKVPLHAWPDHDLIVKLRSLPPNVMVKVNPESLL